MKGYVTIHYLDGTCKEVHVDSLDKTHEEFGPDPIKDMSVLSKIKKMESGKMKILLNVPDDATNEDVLLMMFPELKGQLNRTNSDWLDKEYFQRPMIEMMFKRGFCK